MPIQKDGKTYYTQEEMDARMKASIRRNAGEVAKEICARNKKTQRIYEGVCTK